MSVLINYSVVDNIAVFTIDNPPVNVLSRSVRQELIKLIHRLNNDPLAEAAVLICAGRTFIAGSDISEFNKPPKTPILPAVVVELESSEKLIVAAIHGTALGGGFEVAMACHYRCALASAKVGLPEVNLGLLPGSTGTQRLPRLIGVKKALEILISGKHIPVEKAFEYGAIDRLIEGDLLDGALDYTRELIDTDAYLRRLSKSVPDSTGLGKNFFDNYKEKIRKKYPGYFSPLKIVECVHAATSLSYGEAVKLERQLFNECKASNHSKALRYLFFAERKVSRVKGLNKNIVTRKVNKIAVIGAVTMSREICISLLEAGFSVCLIDKDVTTLSFGVELIYKYLDDEVKKGRMTSGSMNKKMALLTSTHEFSYIRDVDLVIEAIFENLGSKKEILNIFDNICKPGTILATTTATIDPNEIVLETQRPGDVVGMRFFNPADKTRSLEIIRTKKTADDVLMTIMGLAKTIKKVGVVVESCFGSVGNRMLLPYLREAQLMALEGISIEYIDKLAHEWGFAMGPFLTMDMSGLDVFHKIYQSITNKPNKYCYFPLSDILFDMSRLGQKSGAGFYKYKSFDWIVDSDLTGIIQRQAEKHGIIQRSVSDKEIIERLLFSMINEGVLLLEEGVVQRFDDIDVIIVNGLGFPRYRGGPMCYADIVGVRNVYEGIQKYRKRYGEELWSPPRLLRNLAEKDGSFNIIEKVKDK